MFNKVKLKIKNKIKEFLGIYTIIDEINKTKRYIDYQNSSINKRINELNDKVESLHRTLQEVVKVGVDVEYRDCDSWAVVCYNHIPNTPIVKFIPLHNYNGKEITEFLRRFDSGKYKIDTPMRYINEELLYIWNK